jgi:hypothetical protein
MIHCAKKCLRAFTSPVPYLFPLPQWGEFILSSSPLLDFCETQLNSKERLPDRSCALLPVISPYCYVEFWVQVSLRRHFVGRNQYSVCVCTFKTLFIFSLKSKCFAVSMEAVKWKCGEVEKWDGILQERIGEERAVGRVSNPPRPRIVKLMVERKSVLSGYTENLVKYQNFIYLRRECDI